MADGVLGSVVNAARVLKAFSSRHPSYGVSELARVLDLSTSTTHRLLRTLATEHLVEQDPETGRYHLGLAVYDLFAATSPGYGLTEALLPPMTMLRTHTGETIQAAVLDGREVVYIERLESPQSLRMFMHVGRRNDAHATGTGKVLLAHLPADRLSRVLDGWDLPARTSQTLTDPAALRQQLATIRGQGYALNLEESEVGAASVGAPVRDQSGQVVAALSCAGPRQRIEGQLQPITQAVMEAGAAASRRLGHRPHRPRSHPSGARTTA